ncbi:MAG: error-prone DNA polymerase [Candidatus Eremiobacteraeota bacterium]|nr:error-prone DNA polymerase [Candidatus Eremiobacteraeota bacterium]
MPQPEIKGYAELHAWSNFSFLQGGSHPEELVERAAELGLDALALTDRDGLYGAVRFSIYARRRGLEAIIGSELTFEDGARIVLLVEDERGYANLCRLISTAQMRGSKGDARLHMEDLERGSEGLIALSGGSFGRVERALARDGREAAAREARRLGEIFDQRFNLELQQHLTPRETHRNLDLVRLSRECRLPCVATNGVVYAGADDALVADVLSCVREGTTLQTARAANALRPNAEFHLKTPAAMRRLFAEYPEAVERSVEIARCCRFRLERQSGQFPLFPVPDGRSPQSHLRELVYEGAARRYGMPLETRVERQLEYELGLIAKLDLAGYFLIVWDIVREAARLGVLCQGRGSAANSAVCYALGITAVDPIGMNLLFERFMSEERREIPDIDIDFAHQDRELVIQYVYERYGRTNAAMVAEVITYRTRSAIRDVGKALGLSLVQVDAIAREYDAREELPDEAGPELLFAICRRIANFPRHLGIHSGGMLITRDPLVCVAPVEWATMRDRNVIQWDKDDLQDLGLIKIDLLGLGMLSLLREAFTLYRGCVERDDAWLPPAVARGLQLHTIPADDTATYDMIGRADTIGVFQIESRAQQSMLPRMKPACFYDIVMQVAIIRPGPIQGEMVHPFLRRRSGEEAVTYPHPKLKPVLERTLGVPLFQEQGMRLAIEAAGFSGGEADELRRAMGHKRSRERMQAMRKKLIDGMVGNGIDASAAEQLFHMLEGFADYGFPESHAASFALLAYASAYLKCHLPAVFAAAILNVQPMGFYSTEVLVNDARRHGVRVDPVEVNASGYWSHVQSDGALRLGFHLVRGLGEVQKKCLENAIAQGPFKDVLAFAQRTRLQRETLENLAIAGAFAPWYGSRREAMWALRGLDEREARGELGSLMDVDEPSVQFEAVAPKRLAAFDLWSTGVTAGSQVMEHFRDRLAAERVVPAAKLRELPRNSACRVGGLVITRQRPGTAKGFVFLTLEDETGLVNVVVRPDVYERFRRPIRSSPTLIVEGTLQKESGCIDVIAKKIWAFSDEGITRTVAIHSFQ